MATRESWGSIRKALLLRQCGPLNLLQVVSDENRCMGRLEGFRRVISEKWNVKGVFPYDGMLRIQTIEKKDFYESCFKVDFCIIRLQ